MRLIPCVEFEPDDREALDLLRRLVDVGWPPTHPEANPGVSGPDADLYEQHRATIERRYGSLSLSSAVGPKALPTIRAAAEDTDYLMGVLVRQSSPRYWAGYLAKVPESKRAEEANKAARLPGSQGVPTPWVEITPVEIAAIHEEVLREVREARAILEAAEESILDAERRLPTKVSER